MKRPGVAEGCALVCWLALQLAALAIAACRIPLDARPPIAGEQWALGLMVALQMLAGALLSPLLLARGKWTIAAIAAGWPMAALSSFLADASTTQAMMAELFVSVWLLTLHLCVRDEHRMQQLWVACVAALLCAAGPILMYVNHDFADAPSPIMDHAARLSPLMSAIAQTIDPRWSRCGMILIALALIATGRAAISFVKTGKIRTPKFSSEFR